MLGWLTERLGVLRPLRERDFALLWAGMAVSLLGDGFYSVALAWQVYQIANLPSALGVVGGVFTFSRLVALLLGGVVSDRYDRRLVMLAGSLVSCLAIGAMGLLSLAGRLEIWHMAVLVAVYGLGAALILPAFGAIVPQLLPRELLPNANALDQFVRQFSIRLAGPALGGLLIGLAGSGWAFVADAGTFAFAGATLLLMRPLSDGHGAAGRSPLREAADGLRYVLRTPWLWATMLIAGAVSSTLIVGPTAVLLPYVVKNRLGGSATDLGIVFAAGGLGAVLSSGFMGQRRLPRRCVTVMYLGWLVWALPVLVVGFAPRLWMLAAASLVWNGGLAVGQMIWGTLQHLHVPAPLLGRVAALDFQISLGLVPLSYAITGPVANAVGTTPTIAGASLLGAVTMLIPLVIPGVRDPEKAA